MPTNIHIEVPDEDQYDRLKRIKDKYGLTWRGMLVHAANDLDSQSEQ
jgi:predicted urease superfamily metal-dependent hydrolase